MPNDPAVPEELPSGQDHDVADGAPSERGRERLARLALVDIDPSTLELIMAVLTADVCDQLRQSELP